MERDTQDIGVQWQVLHEGIVINVAEAELDRLSDKEQGGNARVKAGGDPPGRGGNS